MPHGYALFRYLVAVAFGSALSVVTYAVVGAPTRVASRLGMRGLKRRRAIENNPIWAQVEPLVRWFGVRVSGLLSDSLRTTLTPEEYVGLSIVSFVGGAIFGVVAGLITGNVMLLLLVCAPMGAGLPYIRISGEQQRRLKQINRGLPYAIDLIALGMSAGLDFPGAVKQVVEKSSDPSDALVEELMRILQELQLGRTRKQALTEFAKRAPTNSVNEFVSAMVQAEDRGNPVAEVLIIQAGVSRQRRTVQAEEAAAKAGVAMVLPLMLLFLCIMILIISPMILKLAKGL
jgi:tight adherence protein C